MHPWHLNIYSWGSHQLLSSEHPLQTPLINSNPFPSLPKGSVFLQSDPDPPAGTNHQTSLFPRHKTGNHLANTGNSFLQNCRESKLSESQLYWTLFIPNLKIPSDMLFTQIHLLNISCHNGVHGNNSPGKMSLSAAEGLNLTGRWVKLSTKSNSPEKASNDLS